MSIPADQVARARERSDVYAAAVALKRSSNLLTGCCVFHAEKSPSFYVYPDWHFHCFGCGAHGDAIAFVMRTRNLDFQAAVRWLLDMPEVAPRHVRTSQGGRSGQERTEADNARVQAILRECGPITDRSAAHLYLWSRGISTKQPGLLSHPALYCHEIGRPLPALVAPLTNSNSAVTSLQRIWCLGSIDGTAQDARAPLQTRKKTAGAMSDGAVRLASPGAILGLAEGVESAIAASMLFCTPTWAVCGAARLGRVWIPPIVKRLYVFGDNGKAGRDLARKAVEQWRERGIRAIPVFPDAAYSDFLDQLIDNRQGAA